MAYKEKKVNGGMANNKNVVTNYFFNVIYNILVVVMPLLTVPYIARVLGPENIGQYGYTQSIVTIFVLFGTLGTQIFAQREIAYVQEDIEKRSIIFWEMLTFRMISVGIVSVFYGIFIVRDSQYSFLFLIQLIDLLAAFFDITWFFQGMEEFKKIVLRNIVVKLTIVILIFCLVKSTEDLYKYVLLHSLALLLGNLSLYWHLSSHIKLVPIKILHPLRHLKRILALFVPQIAVQIYATLDKAMLGSLCQVNGDIQVGYYEQAQKIIRLLLAIVAALGTVMLPRMANAFSKNENSVIKKSLNVSLEFVFFLGLPLMVGISVISGKLVPWFFGDGYEAVEGLIIATSPVIVITGISNLIGMQFLLPTKQQREYTIAVTLASCTNVILNLLLIPYRGAIGATIASVLAECVAIGVEIVLIREYIEFRRIVRVLIKYVIFSSCMGITVWFVGTLLPAHYLTTFLQAIVGVITYLVFLKFSNDRFLLLLWDNVRNRVKKCLIFVRKL